jgi:hypothetical protein
MAQRNGARLAKANADLAKVKTAVLRGDLLEAVVAEAE